MVSTASNAPLFARRNTVSAGNGPSAAIPSRLPASTAGAMMSISSRPKLPLSPACGFGMAEIDKHGRAVARERFALRRSGLDLRLDRGNARALVEHASIADHYEARLGADFVERSNLRRQLRADAGRIAHGQRNHR